jgi:integrase
MRRFKNKALPKGIVINRDYVWVRFYPKGLKEFKRLIGPASQPGMVDLAISVLNDYRELTRCQKFDAQPKEKRVTVEEAANLFMDIYGKKKSDGGYMYNLYFNKLSKFFDGQYLDQIDFSDVEKMRGWLEDKGRTVATANRYQASLSCLFNVLKRAKKRKEIQPIRLPDENPCKFVTKPSERDRIRNRILSFKEYHAFLDVAEQEGSSEGVRIFKGALMTMLRMGDLMSLKIDNVNHISNRLSGIQNKTGKPFSIYVIDELKELIATAPSDDYVFDFTNFRPTWEHLRQKAGLHDFQFRDLRRSAATWIYKKGATLRSISHYLGHQSEEMTRRYIGIHSEDEMITGKYMSSIFQIPRDTRLRKGELIPMANNPVIDVSKLEIPWIPNYSGR